MVKVSGATPLLDSQEDLILLIYDTTQVSLFDTQLLLLVYVVGSIYGFVLDFVFLQLCFSMYIVPR